MKTRISYYFLCLLIIVSSVSASVKGPIPISPGSDVGIAVVAESCPTFSWTDVEWATGYRIEVFEAIRSEDQSYEEMTARGYPILNKEIQGRALSWTPSSNERLSNGGVYVWYVQAMDAYGMVKWSEGRTFNVKLNDRFDGLVDKLTETLKEHELSDELIGEVLKDLSLEVKDVNVVDPGTKGSGYNTTDRIGIQGLEDTNNTFYGLSAGFTIQYIGGTGLYNTFIGYYAGYSDNTGNYNTFIGHNAGFNNDTGNNNTFMGYRAGYTNIGGLANTFMGYRAGYQNTGNNNTFIGHNTGYNNTGGFANTFVGYNSGYSTTAGPANTFVGFNSGYNNTGAANTFMGYRAGYNNLTGAGNIFIGYNSGYTNTTESNNTFVGYNSGHNSTGKENTFIGSYSGYNNSTGHNNTFLGYKSGNGNDTGYDNVFLGDSSGYSNTSGRYNIFVGNAAGHHNENGTSNVFIGAGAGYSNTEGHNNIIIGTDSGFYNTIGDENTFIGSGAGHHNTTGNGNVFLGYNAGYGQSGSYKLHIDSRDDDFPLIYGEFNNDFVAINGKLGVGTQSPAYDLEVETTGKNAIFVLDRTDGAKAGYAAYSNMALLGTVSNHPLMLGVNYAWRLRLNSDNSLLMSNGAQCTAGGVWQDASSRAYKENIVDLTFEDAKKTLLDLNPVKYNYKKDREDEHLGFIAEDVPDLVASKDRKGMSPMDVAAVLTKVVQEQQETLKFQQEALKEQQDTISELQKRIADLEKKSQ